MINNYVNLVINYIFAKKYMRQLVLLCLILISLSSCSKSDNNPGIEPDNAIAKVSNIGLHEVKLTGLSGGNWYFKEKDNKGEYLIAERDKQDPNVYVGLNSATTYYFSYRKGTSYSTPIRVTTKAFELDYQATKKANYCGAFDRQVMQSDREYKFYTLNAIEYNTVDLYLIDQIKKDSIKVPTKLSNDNKLIAFTIPKDYAINEQTKQNKKLGFKVKDKMEYFYNTQYVNEINQMFQKTTIVPAENYTDKVQPFYIENERPFIQKINVVKDEQNKYFYFDIEGRFYDLEATSPTNCNLPALPFATTISIYKDNLESRFFSVSRQLGDDVIIKDVKVKGVPMYNFTTFVDAPTPVTVPATRIKLYMDQFPKGKYLFKVDVLLLNSNHYESNIYEMNVDDIRF
jgi:hypothetical protein